MSFNTKEQTIFAHKETIIQTDRQINVIARLEEPLIVVLDNVLSNEECDQFIQFSKDRLKRSKIGQSRETNDIRTSSGMFFERSENEFIKTIENRIARVMNIPVEHGEGIQILHYHPGQEFKPHHDFFSSSDVTNNRISTLVMFLNDVEEGGETHFPLLDFSVTPVKGSAVYFEYFYQDNALNELTLHAGKPVTKGEKWVATQWMRKQRL